MGRPGSALVSRPEHDRRAGSVGVQSVGQAEQHPVGGVERLAVTDLPGVP